MAKDHILPDCNEVSDYADAVLLVRRANQDDGGACELLIKLHVGRAIRQHSHNYQNNEDAENACK